MKIRISPSRSASLATSCDEGVTIILTPGATRRPSRILAALRRSVILEFVQEPMNTWSTRVPSTSSIGAVLSGDIGLASVIGTCSASISNVRSYTASGSDGDRLVRPLGAARRYSSVTSSQAMIPFLAPASIAMLVIVRRASMSRWRERLAGVLHRLGARAVHADRADDVEDQVLALDPVAEAVVVDEAQRLRDAEPQLAGAP